MGRLSKDKRDVFYRQAKESGYRARSAFKLLQLDEAFDLFVVDKKDDTNMRVKRAVDLCAAPGSWSQVLSEKLYENRGHVSNHKQQQQEEEEEEKEELARIVAVDLQPMSPLAGVLCMEGDITSIVTANAIIEHFRGQRAELVVCDGAPDVTGLHDFDEFVQGQLVLSAVNIATHLLCEGGTFVTKTFRGRDAGIIYTRVSQLFQQVAIGKPATSRNSSIESFLVCKGFLSSNVNLPLGRGGIDPSWKSSIVPFVACKHIQGSTSGNSNSVGFLDSDKSYPVHITTEEKEATSPNKTNTANMHHTYIQPIAPPIRPAYETSIAKAKEARAQKSVLTS